MHYVILNNQEYFKDKININNFNEVSIRGNSRVDGVFAEITSELLEHGYTESTDGNRFFGEEWLCGDRGVQFVVIKIPQDILYSEHQEYIDECFKLFNKESFFVELWSIKHENKEKYEYFIIGYNKNFGHQILGNDEFVEKKEQEVIPYICKKIEKNLFKT